MTERNKIFRTSWIESIDVKRQIYWLGSTNAILDLLDDSVHSDCVNFSGLNDLESTVSVILIIAWTAQRRADTSVNVGVVGEQALLCSMVKICAMVDAGNFAR